MDILVDNKIKTLTHINQNNGLCIVSDFIGGSDGFDGYDCNQDMYIMTREHYKFWCQFFKIQKELDEKEIVILENLSEAEADIFEQALVEAVSTDPECMQWEQKQVVDVLKDVWKE